MAIQKRDCFTSFAMTAILSIILLAVFSSLFAEEIPISWEADKAESYMENDKITKVILKGNAEVKKDSLLIKGEEIEYNRQKNQILIPGSALLLEGKIRIEGKDLLYNLKEESGSLKEVSFVNPPWYGKGEELKIEKKGQYLIKNGYITTCEFFPPHYRLKAKKIKVSVKDKLEAKNLTLYAGKVPVLYLPYYNQNLKEGAESFFGFVLGQDTDWGLYLLNTFTFPLKGYSASYHFDLREKKGVGVGFDLKKKPKDGEEGILKTYYIKEKDTDKERYQFNYKYRDAWEEDEREMVLLSEAHKLADREFLKDYFYNDYLEERQPRTYLSLTERKPQRFLNFLVRKKINDFYSVTERLPEVNLSFPLQNFGKNLYFRSETNLANLRKEIEGETKTSVRLDTFNELTASRRYKGWLNVRPHTGLRLTSYTKNKEGKEAFRSLEEAGLDLGTKFQKHFNMKNANFLHIVEPRLSFDYQEVSLPPEKLLNFDSIDNLHSDKYITAQLINRICPKEEKLDLLRASLKTNYSLSESRFKDTSLIFNLNPRANWSFCNESHYDIPGKFWKTSTSNFSWWKKKHSFNLSHYYQNEGSNSLVPSFYWEISPKWQAKFTTSYRLEEKDFESREIVLYRDLHCWKSSISFYRDSTQRSVFLTFYLTAFPKNVIGIEKTFEG